MDFLRHGLGDAEVQSLTWLNKGEDLEISLSMPGEQGTQTVVLFRWVTQLKIEMGCGQLIGQPPIYDAILEKVGESHKLSLSFGGALRGGIRFRFHEAEIASGLWADKA